MPVFSNQPFDYNFGYLPPAAATTNFNITYDDLRPAAGAKRQLSEPAARTTGAISFKRNRLADNNSLDMLCINTIRLLSADMVQAANSGHPGAPMGCAPMAHALWAHVMKHSPTNPSWINRDRFVLSNGHACALLYSLLHLAGFDLTIDDLKSFRKLDSKCPGHPENFHTPGVEVTTGPLGQGLSMAVGMALVRAARLRVAARAATAPTTRVCAVLFGREEQLAAPVLGTMRIGSTLHVSLTQTALSARARVSLSRRTQAPARAPV
jgi:hypothetical protein